MIIRSMTPRDSDTVLSLWKKTPGMGLNNRDDSPIGLERFLARNLGLSVIAEENGQVVGALLTGHDGRRGFFYHLAVDVDHQRQGIARQMVTKALESLQEAKISKVLIFVRANNEIGKRFWASLGFEAEEYSELWECNVLDNIKMFYT